MIYLYEIVVARLKPNEGWSKGIKCTIVFKKVCPLSLTLFGIYINKVEEYLETAGYKGIELTGIIITLLLYADDIVLLARSHDVLEKHLKTLHVYYSKCEDQLTYNSLQAHNKLSNLQ